jgi:hypothetical protein
MRRVLVPVLCGVLLLGGCGVPGGVEVEGRASQVDPPTTSTTPIGTPASADAVAVLRADPLLNPKFKDTLAPCEDGYYPVSDRYVDLTGDGKVELLATLYPCPDAVQEAKGLGPQTYGLASYYGYAAYVYNLATKPPTRLLAAEDGPVELVSYKKEANILVLIRYRWGPRDDPCCPSDQTEVLYHWDGTKFIEGK